MRTGFLTYAWDLLDSGPEQPIQTMASRYQCNALMLNAAYHHARLLRPRAVGKKIWQLPGAVAAFEPNPECYPGQMKPLPDHRLVDSAIIPRARDACAAENLDFGLWAVGLHNSSLGTAHPHICLQNCFGDLYSYSLCPSHPEVRAYLVGLLTDLCQQFRPQRILLEAIGYLSLRHGVHHELFFSPWSQALELLLSLCFCPACLDRANAAGVNGAALQRRVAQWVERCLNEEPENPSLSFAQGEAMSLLLELPDLYPYVRLRSQVISTLVSELRAITNAQAVMLELIPASFHRPASQAWLEGASLAELGSASDGLLIPAYHDTAFEVAADLWWTASLAPQAQLSAALNPCSPSLPGEAALVAQAAACQSANCAALYYYNYGLLTNQRLAWVRQANTSLME